MLFRLIFQYFGISLLFCLLSLRYFAKNTCSSVGNRRGEYFCTSAFVVVVEVVVVLFVAVVVVVMGVVGWLLRTWEVGIFQLPLRMLQSADVGTGVFCCKACFCLVFLAAGDSCCYSEEIGPVFYAVSAGASTAADIAVLSDQAFRSCNTGSLWAWYTLVVAVLVIGFGFVA